MVLVPVTYYTWNLCTYVRSLTYYVEYLQSMHNVRTRKYKFYIRTYTAFIWIDAFGILKSKVGTVPVLFTTGIIFELKAELNQSDSQDSGCRLWNGTGWYWCSFHTTQVCSKEKMRIAPVPYVYIIFRQNQRKWQENIYYVFSFIHLWHKIYVPIHSILFALIIFFSIFL